jgi:hypothetical protein
MDGFGLDHRRFAAVSLVVVAAVTTIIVLSVGSGNGVRATRTLNMAAVLNNGLLRIIKIGSPRIISPGQVSQPRTRPVRRVLHRAPRPQPAPHTTERLRSATATAPTYDARATPTSPTLPHHSSLGAASAGAETSPPQAGVSRASGASVAPTGESGALGPVQSPNG